MMTEQQLNRLEALVRLEPPSEDTWTAACRALLGEVRSLHHRLEHAVAAREDALAAYDTIRARLDALEQARPGGTTLGSMATKKKTSTTKLKRRYLATVEVEVEAESEAGLKAAVQRMVDERQTVFALNVCDLKYGCFSVEPKGITSVVEQD